MRKKKINKVCLDLLHIQTGTGTVGCRLFGKDQPGPLIVVSPGLGSLSAEWWHLGEQLAGDGRCPVLVYDRAGYGCSSPATEPRTPAQVAGECRDLLAAMGYIDPVVLIGHGLGGLYMEQFARLYPDQIRGLVLIDPWSARYARLQQSLPAKLYEGSGIDRTRSLTLARRLSWLPLDPLTRMILLKAPPFFYYNDFSPEALGYLERYMVRPRLYRTALEEYAWYKDPQITVSLGSPGAFPAVPLRIIYHDPEFVIKEMMLFGSLDRTEALQVEELWQELTRDLLALSPDSTWGQASSSGHYLHLTEYGLVRDAVISVCDGNRN